MPKLSLGKNAVPKPELGNDKRIATYHGTQD